MEDFKFENGWDYYPFQIGSHFLTALINEDSSGLSDEEEVSFDEWVYGALELVLNTQTFHWDCDNESYFGRDDVSGLMGDVVGVRLVFKKEKKCHMRD
jgi:hypothetical protein